MTSTGATQQKREETQGSGVQIPPSRLKRRARAARRVHCGVTASPSILKTHGNTRSRVRGARRRTHSKALGGATAERPQLRERPDLPLASSDRQGRVRRSEEHTSELQSRPHLV